VSRNDPNYLVCSLHIDRHGTTLSKTILWRQIQTPEAACKTPDLNYRILLSHAKRYKEKKMEKRTKKLCKNGHTWMIGTPCLSGTEPTTLRRGVCVVQRQSVK